MPVQDKKFFHALAIALLAAGATVSAAQADDDENEGFFSEWRGVRHGGGGHHGNKALLPAQTNAKFQKECSDCHIPYPPGLMSAESWRKVMAGLDKHFGTDASLYAEDQKEITDYLVSNASNRWSGPGTPLRISETAWFRRKHDGHEVNPDVWKNPKVKSPANCGACHPDAERGDFNEHRISIPR